ncbi:hypothetical protein DYB25_011310 [Aphanomyces astaci]|uniref:O-GlcNAc transferase C-terminal domain-containing protein n=1 Tax=Aphanomyces astaci TaxID=112090 RepID=A0A397ATV2_APHAT|nr:hypothetical protein DYB25_011310 [Aphanomyces astaci]
MDAVVRRILKRDPLGHMFFLASLSHWNAAFADRMTLQPGLPIDRVHLIDSSEVSVAALLRACDVHLANLYTNAFQHTLEAVAAGVPTVTLPGQLWRTRVPFGVLRHINAVATVATSAADYVRLAVRAAGDQPFRDAVVATLHSNGPKLFGDDTAVIEWTRFLHFALDQARRVRQETPVM